MCRDGQLILGRRGRYALVEKLDPSAVASSASRRLRLAGAGCRRRRSLRPCAPPRAGHGRRPRPRLPRRPSPRWQARRRRHRGHRARAPSDHRALPACRQGRDARARQSAHPARHHHRGRRRWRAPWRLDRGGDHPLPGRHAPALGRVVRVLGSDSALATRVEVILGAHGVPSAWPEAVTEALGELPAEVRATDLKGRVDPRRCSS